MDLAARPRAVWLLALVSFAESSFFPIPPDVMLIPMVLAAPTRAWRIAAVCTIASVIGGAFGYVIGITAFEAVGRPVLEIYGYMHKFEDFQDLYREWGIWIVSAGGFTPLPYKVITITSGVMQLDVVTLLAGVAGFAGTTVLHRRRSAVIFRRADPALHRSQSRTPGDALFLRCCSLALW